MNQTGKTIVKNASVLMSSQLITWILTLALMVYLPRFLGATAMGQFHLANSIWAIAGVFATFGMDIFLTKQISRDPDNISEIFGVVLVFRALVFAIGFGFVALYVQLAGYAVETINVIFIIGLSAFFVLCTGATRAALQGVERMEFISLADIASKIFMTVVGLSFLFLGKGIIVISFVVIGASIVNLLIQGVFLNRLQSLHFQFNWHATKQVVRASFPYFLVTVFAVIYIQLDVVIISLIVDEEVVGWYGAADGLLGTLMFIPYIFMTAVFPALSRLHAGEDESNVLGKLMSKSFDMLALLSIPIGLGIMVIADSVVVLLFGEEFTNSGPILAVMGIVIMLTYQNMLLGRFIISIDRQNTWTIIMAVATVAKIPLDFLLVTWCQRLFGNGGIGAALAFVITEGAMMVTGLYVLPRGLLGRQNALTAGRALIAGLIMTMSIWFLRDYFIAIPIIVGAMVYLSLIVIMRIVPKEDWLVVGNLAQKPLARLRNRHA